VAACAAGLVSACGPHRIRTPERSSGQSLIVLLPDLETGVVGKAVVSNPKGSTGLDGSRESTQVSANQSPSPAIVMSEAEVQRIFAIALSALPPPPQHFTLYFRFQSDELTAQSSALVQQILKAVKDRPFADVIVVGHTDTTGTDAANFELGLKRAKTVRNFLVEAGLDASFIDVISHGESDPLIATADGVFEPRNRRVEITVR
jgi:outer membrane protein OmpA-like peptidoglycan-associated protein